jgi:hypothetical protein
MTFRGAHMGNSDFRPYCTHSSIGPFQEVALPVPAIWVRSQTSGSFGSSLRRELTGTLINWPPQGEWYPLGVKDGVGLLVSKSVSNIARRIF